jgi:uncharacterized protein
LRLQFCLAPQTLETLDQHRFEQGGFGGKVTEHGSDPNVGLPGHLLGGRRFATLTEDAFGGLKDADTVGVGVSIIEVVTPYRTTILRQVSTRRNNVTHSMTPREVFLELVHAVCERRITDLPRLYATATNVAHPFDPLRSPPLRTRDELREHCAGGADSGASFRLRPTNITIDDTSDPEVIVAAFTYLADVTETGDKFAIPCIFVLRVRDGEIVESRDYIDHLRSGQTRGQLDMLLDAVKRQSGQG